MVVLVALAAGLAARFAPSDGMLAGDSVCSAVFFDSGTPTPTGDATPEPPHRTANICNPDAAPKSVLDVSAVGGGYGPIVLVVHNPPGCGAPSVERGPTSASFEITWPVACVNQGATAGVLVGASCQYGCYVALTCYDWKDTAQTDSPCFSCTLYEPGCEYWGGYLDCYDGPNPEDALPMLIYVAGMPSTLPQSCPQIGSGSGAAVFGDLNCDGTIDVPDLLRLLRHFAWLPDRLVEGCRAMN